MGPSALSLPLDPFSTFSRLPPRPPTPPREMQDAPEPLLKQVSFLDPRASLQTPPSAHTPLSASKTGSTGSRKKVEFSAEPHYQEAPVYAAVAPGRTTPVAVLVGPPSSGSRPVKSILKATSYEATLAYDAAAQSTPPPVSIAAMLASAVQQLAGADRDAKLDAYLMLARALKASDNLPDRIALQSKMTLFAQFLQRDIATARTAAGTLDAALVLAALDLLNTFLRFPAIAATVPSDFGVFILEHCIRSFAVVEVSRTVLRALMRVVGLQSFPPKVMTADRVGRLVAALHQMEDQMESRNTLLLRCMIYRTLVRNQRLLMAQHLDWLPDLLVDMLSTAPVIREAAISLGLEAGFALGRERAVLQRVGELLQATLATERYVEYYASCLLAMMKDKDDAPYVPQVWSVVTLFLRTPDRWDYFVPWLRILQACFNSSDYRTKAEANYAWGRFVYAATREHRVLPPKLFAILTKALVSQLRRRGAGKAYDDHRRVVLGTVGTLLYYTARPNAAPAALDCAWDSAVQPVVRQLLEPPAGDEARAGAGTEAGTGTGAEARQKYKANRETASALLTGLLTNTVARPWHENRVVKSPLVLPEDLPAVDPKWVRRNAARVFGLVGPILQQSFLDLATPRSATQTLWRALVASVAVATAKEVKVATETAVFVGHALSLLLHVWTAGVPTTDADGTRFAATQLLAATREFLLTMVDAMGALPFTEKQLARDGVDGFVAVGTPSQRPGKDGAAPRAPLHHLFAILSTLPRGVPDNGDFADFVECIFSPFFSAKSGRGRRSLALDLLQMLPPDAPRPYGPWQVVARRIAASLDANSSTPGSAARTPGGSSGSHSFQLSPVAGGDGAPLGLQYRDIVRVLERGLRATPKLPFSRWQALFCTLSDRVRASAGDAGLALCVLDPLAKALAALETTERSPTAACAVVELLSVATPPRDRQAMDAARRRLWGTAIATAASSSLADPLENVCQLVGSTLEQQYRSLGTATDVDTTLLLALGRFMAKGSPEWVCQTLSTVQDGLALWLGDAEGRIGRQSAAAAAVLQLWSSRCVAWGVIGGALPLEALSGLFCAALSSTHRAMVNRTLELWVLVYRNGNGGPVAYPAAVQACLEALQPRLVTAIPGLVVGGGKAKEEEEEGEGEAPNMEAIDMEMEAVEADDMQVPDDMVTPHPARSPFALLANKRPTAPLATTSPSAVNAQRTASKAVKVQAKRRHDDSQMVFAPIAPVSVADETNSQASQMLTERQREVRLRQRETVLFGVSSPGGDVERMGEEGERVEEEMQEQGEDVHVDMDEGIDPIDVDTTQDNLPLPRLTTPEAVRTLPARSRRSSSLSEHRASETEEFIASTPTPRRGPSLVLPVHDTDPPSSPPEPRRYPLMPEMGTRSRSNSILDDWPFSSSPVSGSPMARHTAPEPELSMEGERGGEGEGEADGKAVDEVADVPMDETVDETVLDETVFDETVDPVDPVNPVNPVETVSELPRPDPDALPSSQLMVEITPMTTRRRKAVTALPATPTRQRVTRSRKTAPPASSGRVAHTRQTATPAAAGRQPMAPLSATASREAMLAEAMSPHPVSGRRRFKIMAAPSPLSQEQFRLSAGDERSMLRLAMELDPRRATPARGPSDETAQDCITVWTDKDKDKAAEGSPRVRRRNRKRKRSEARSLGSLGSLGESPQVEAETPSQETQEMPHRTKRRAALTPRKRTPSPQKTAVREEDEVHSQLALELQEREHVQAEAAKGAAAVEEEDMNDNDHDHANDHDNDGDEQPPPAKKARGSSILAMLRDSLALLRTATLTRKEVDGMEDVCMDIKRELYDAERRGR